MDNVAAQLLERKKQMSPFANLTNDGDTIEGLVTNIKTVTKEYMGEESEALRITMQCDLPEIGIVMKNFDNGSMKWLNEVTSKNIEKGDTIRITRHGAYKSNATFYTADVLLKKGKEVDPVAEALGIEIPADDPMFPDEQ